MHSFRGYFLSAMAVLAAAPLAAWGVLERGIAFVWAWLAPEPRDFTEVSFEGLSLGYTGHVALDPALQQEMRHEAGMKRMAAARHC